MCASKTVAVTGCAAALFVILNGCRSEEPRPVADPASRRVTAMGTVVGFVGRYGHHEWRGIPFAAPPLGALRWRAPQPPPAWTETREALDFGSPCTQYASPFGGVPGREGSVAGNEDCLYLNVYAPRFAEAEAPTGGDRMPVMLWIHGGGNTIGEPGFYNGGHLAATHKVVVVMPHYRLGPFGWFRHAALRGNGSTPLDESGNFGTLDLIRALHWVRENAAAFGGDPNNVTIFGESAGGTNVVTLLLSPHARGLFHRAIVQSGSLQMRRVGEAEDAADSGGHASSSAEVAVRLLVADGTARDRAAAQAHVQGMPPADLAAYLRGQSAAAILNAYTPLPGMGMVDMPTVFRDGTVLPDADPLERLADTGGYNAVPVMLGTTRDENKLFMQGDPQLVRRILWIVPRIRDERMYNLIAEYMAKMWKANGADEPATVMRTAQGPSVYVYRFDWDEEPRMLGTELSVLLGAAHGFEIPFVFGHYDLGTAGNMIFTKDNEPGRLTLSAQMMSYWAEFAWNGSPGRGRDGRQPEWTAWDNSTPESPKFIVLDTPADGGLRMAADSVTGPGVLAAVDADPRLPSQRDKCTIYRSLAQWSRGFTKADYPTAGRQGCKEFPFEAYPWK